MTYDIETLKDMCTTKRAYYSAKLAKRVAFEARQKRGTELRVYACPACGQWHITKAPLREDAQA
jgi:hypothetical protein